MLLKGCLVLRVARLCRWVSQDVDTMLARPANFNRSTLGFTIQVYPIPGNVVIACTRERYLKQLQRA